MTITLELTLEQEGLLKRQANAVGLKPTEYLVHLIDQGSKLETVADRMKRLGVLGGVEGKPRPDGRPWSEVEGFE